MEVNDKVKIIELEHRIAALERECDVLKKTLNQLTTTIERLFLAYMSKK